GRGHPRRAGQPPVGDRDPRRGGTGRAAARRRGTPGPARPGGVVGHPDLQRRRAARDALDDRPPPPRGPAPHESRPAGRARPTLPAAVDQAAYRIVQEALANALRHGGGGPVEVTLDHDAGALRIEVANDVAARPVATSGTSCGTVPSEGSSGVGLLTMRERAEALGGTFHAGPDGDRWRVRAAIPTEEDR